jgi:GntR family histidine utilization transcriptional repressor
MDRKKQKQRHAFDPSIPRPLYQQVKHFISEQIRSGEWGRHSKIPSENELVDSLGVSRMTINRALSELTGEGHLIRLQGVGTFVAQPKPLSALLEIKSIAEEIKNMGGVHSCEVYLLQEETVSQELAGAMELPVGAPVFHSILIHRDRGKAIQLEDRYVNPAMAPDYLKQDFTAMTPSEYLTGLSPATEVEHIIEAILPDEEVQGFLEIDPHEPCLVLYRRTWVNDIVVSKNSFFYPGSRYRIGGRFKPASLNRRGMV